MFAKRICEAGDQPSGECLEASALDGESFQKDVVGFADVRLKADEIVFWCIRIGIDLEKVHKRVLKKGAGEFCALQPRCIGTTEPRGSD